MSTTWKQWGRQPWRSETFKFFTDRELEAKIRDVVGLYLNPPDKAIVLYVDEKSQISGVGPDRADPADSAWPLGLQSSRMTVSGTAPLRCSRRWRLRP